MEVINALKRIGEKCNIHNESKLIRSYKYSLFTKYLEYALAKNDISEFRERYAKDFKKFFGIHMMKEVAINVIEIGFKKFCDENGEIKDSAMRDFLKENGMDTKFTNIF